MPMSRTACVLCVSYSGEKPIILVFSPNLIGLYHRSVDSQVFMNTRLYSRSSGDVRRLEIILRIPVVADGHLLKSKPPIISPVTAST